MFLTTYILIGIFVVYALSSPEETPKDEELDKFEFFIEYAVHIWSWPFGLILTIYYLTKEK